MDSDLLNGIGLILFMTMLMAIPWALIGRLIGDREDMISGRPKFTVWGFGRRRHDTAADENIEPPPKSML